jgi:hypothetical protein
MSNEIEPFFDEAIEGDLLEVRAKGLMGPMGDGPYPRRIWEPWRAGMEAAPGITLGTDDHTELFARVSGYLRDAEANARRMCACWNAFLGVPLEEIEAMALKRTGWRPPDKDAMWRSPFSPPMKSVAESKDSPSTAPKEQD